MRNAGAEQENSGWGIIKVGDAVKTKVKGHKAPAFSRSSNVKPKSSATFLLSLQIV
jgi:hypothetical protein